MNIELVKRRNSDNIILIFFMKLYIVGTHKKRLHEALLMNIHNICFHTEIKYFVAEKCLIWSYG